jgi:hypothetical protein
VAKEEAVLVKEAAPAKEEAAPAAVATETENCVLNNALSKGSKYVAAPAAITEHLFGGNMISMIPWKEGSENAPMTDDALQELQVQLSNDTSQALSKAHQELAKLSSLGVSKLDTISLTQLIIYLVQMAREDLKGKTKWEAVWLKEFLAMNGK